jgi:hypothetical protein
VGDDQYQKNLETIKLRIAFLQHLATLSGAATVIVLATIQRTETTLVITQLAFVLGLFGVATLVCVIGAAMLIKYTQKEESDLESRAGWITAEVAGGLFAAGVLSLMIAGFRLPLLAASVITIVVLVIALILYRVLYRTP